VQVGTELAWTYASQRNKPSMFVVNHIDKADLDLASAINQLKERFGRGVTLVQFPVGKDMRTIIDVLLMKQLTFPAG